jgi:hypothetical protein
MKTTSSSKFFLLFTLGILFLGCSKEEIPQDKLIGDWTVYSITNENGQTIVWEELKATLVELITEYSCLAFTANATENLVSTTYIFIDENSRGCLTPSIAVYTWELDSESGLYLFKQGNKVINYRITFSNGDNRMTWNDQTSGVVTIWDRVVPATEETTE